MGKKYSHSLEHHSSLGFLWQATVGSMDYPTGKSAWFFCHHQIGKFLPHTPIWCIWWIKSLKMVLQRRAPCGAVFSSTQTVLGNCCSSWLCQAASENKLMGWGQLTARESTWTQLHARCSSWSESFKDIDPSVQQTRFAFYNAATHCLNLFDFIRLLWGLNPPSSPPQLAGARLGFKDSDKKLQL